ncbi:MAG: PQQ-binding-like beta-propeller repeat protein [Acidimicrobiales bacterium]
MARGPSPATAHVRWSAKVTPPVQAEPLVVDGEVIVATEDDTVMAFSTTDGSRKWQAHLGSPVPGSSLPCGNIDPSGITGTPVADPASGTLWVVAFLRPAHHVLVGLSLSTGHVVSRRTVDPPGANPLVEQERGALALAHGRVYIPYGGLFGDCGDYHGYVVGVPVASGPLVTFRAVAARQAGIWVPSGPAVGPAGDLFVATGNGTPPGGNRVIRLDPSLRMDGFFAPSNAASLDRQDLDLGSTGPALLPGGLVLQVGKSGIGYLLDAHHLGGPGGQLFAGPVCQAAFGADAVAGARAYVPCTNGLYAVAVSLPPSRPSFRLAWHSPAFSAGPPIVAGSTVWVLDPSRERLLGLKASDGSQVASLAVGAAPRFTTPTAAGGQLYLVAGGHLLDIGS